MDPGSPSAKLSDRFEILQELGRGGMGIVYQARDRETGEIVALKMLRTEIACATQMVNARLSASRPAAIAGDRLFALCCGSHPGGVGDASPSALEALTPEMLADWHRRRYPAKINAVDETEVQNVAQKYFRPEGAQTVVVGDAARLRSDLAKLGPVEM